MKKLFFKFLTGFILFLLLLPFGTNVYAQTINLRIEGPETIILDSSVSLPETCEVVDSGGATSTFDGSLAICALQKAKDEGLVEEFSVTDWDFAFSLDNVNGISNASDWSELWIIRKNFAPSETGIDGLELSQDDELLVTFGPWPMEPLTLSFATTTVYAVATTTISAKVWDDSQNSWQDFANTTIFKVGEDVIESGNGQLEFTPDATGTLSVWVEAPAKTRSKKIEFQVLPPIPQSYFFIRYQEDVLFTEFIDLAESGQVNVSEIPTGTSTLRDSNSVLVQLLNTDNAIDTFNITQLQYFSSFDSFYLKCIEIPEKVIEACDNWQYAVNDVFPEVGMDAYILSGGEEVFIFFGNNRQVVLSTTSVFVDQSFQVIAQKYNYKDDTWEPEPDVTLGVIQPDPDNPWTPIEVATSSPDSQGNATFKISIAGEYQLGIQEDFYWPTVSFSVLNPPASPGTGGEGGGGGIPPAQNLDLKKAIQFLSAIQDPDGSFGNPMFTDWAAIAFGAYNPQHSAAQNIKAHLMTDPSPGESLGSPVLSFIRRAMALMALGINPYSGAGTNYIQKILDAFDANQIGDKNLVNDDIFALLALGKAGYSASDEIVQKTTQFILAKQNTNGSWGDVDMTAAAVQALSLFLELDLVSSALSQAETYLQNQQKPDAGFGNLDSTSWAMQAITALGKDWKTWVKNGKSPGDYLYSIQKQDGSLDSPMPVWSTAYAIPAALAKPWESILNSFSKQEILPGFTPPSAGETIFEVQEEKETVQVEIRTENLEMISQQLTDIAEQIASLELQVALLAAESKAAAKSRTAAQSEAVPESFIEEQETMTVETSESSLFEEEKTSPEITENIPLIPLPVGFQERGAAEVSRFFKIPVSEIIANKIFLLTSLIKRSFWSGVSEIRQSLKTSIFKNP